MHTEDDVRAALRVLADDAPDPGATWSGLQSATRPPAPHHPRRRRLTVALAAAASVLVIAVATVFVSHGVTSRARPQQPQRSSGLPRYLVNIPAMGVGLLDVRDAVTGSLGSTIRITNAGYYWYALAAEGPQTFVAAEDVAPATSYFFRFTLGSGGKTTSIQQAGPKVRGTVMGMSVTPDGKYVAYLLSSLYGKTDNNSRDQLILANLVTGKVLAHWPVPVADTVASLSVDAAGNAIAISAYTYNPASIYEQVEIHADLIQWTSVLRANTSGTPIDRLPKALPQASTSLALSPDGRTLWTFLQAGPVNGGSWRDPRPANFYLAAVSLRENGTVLDVATVHGWRAVWANFKPVLALVPGGRYLLIADNSRLARFDTATGHYATLGHMPALEIGTKFPALTQGGDLNPLAW
jgi:hypothetical protein